MLCEIWLSRALDVPGMSGITDLISRKAARRGIRDGIELFYDSLEAKEARRELRRALNRAVGRATGLGLASPNLVRLVFIAEDIVLKQLLVIKVGSVEERAALRQNVRDGVDSIVLEIVGRDEDRLQDESKKLRGILDSTEVGLFRSTPEGQWIALSATAAKIMGCESVQQAMGQMSPANYADSAERERMLAVLKGKGVVDGVLMQFRRADGELRWGQMFCSGILDDEGELVEIEGFFRDVTDTAEAKLRLGVERQRYHDMLAGMGAGLAVLDADRRIVWANDLVSKWFGPMDEIIGKHCYEVYRHRQTACEGCEAERCFATGEMSAGEEHRGRRTDGEEIIFNVVASPMKGRTGKIEQILEVLEDVTGLRRAEEAMRESEAKFRAVFEQARDGFLLVAEDGKILEFNDAAHNDLGYTRDEFEQLSLHDIDANESADDVSRHMQQIMSEESVSFETKHRTKNGELRDVLVDGRVIELAGRRVFSGIWRDITERRRAEEALRASEERYRYLIDNSRDIVYSTDAEGIMTFCSPHSMQYGYDPSEIVGRPFTDFLHPEDVDRTVRNFREMFETGVSVPGYFRLRRSDGSYVETEEFGAPIFEGHEVVGTSGVIMDITERKKAEAKFRESEEKFSVFVSESAYGYLETDAQGRLTFVNRKMTEISGFGEKEMLGRNMLDFLIEEDVERAKANLAKVLTGPNEGPRHYSICHKDDSRREVEVNTLSLAKDGRFVGYQSTILDVTERTRAEEALRESEERHRVLFESSRDAIMTLAPPSWRFTAGNPATVKMFRAKDQTEFTGLGPWEVSPELQPDGQPSDRKAKAMIETAMREGSNFFEWTHRRLDGEEFATTVLLTRMTLAGRTLLQATVRDITERKRAAEAIRESEDKYRTLVEHLPQRIFLKDRNSIYISCNQNYARDMGIAPKEIKGKTDFDFHPRELAEKYREDDRRIIASEQMESLEERYGKGEQEAWVDTIKIPVRDKEGNVFGLLGIFMDITERKRAAEALRESEEKWRSLVENAAAYIMTLERDGTIVFLNRTVPGITMEEAIGSTVYDHVSAEHHETMRRSIERVFETGEPGAYEVVGVGVHGDECQYESRVGPIMHDGEVVAVNLISTDVTEKKTLERRIFEQERRHYENLEREVSERTRELEEANRELRRLDEMKDQFLANVSHELRTPLVSGIGYIELLLQGGLGPVTREARKGLEISHRNLNRLVALIEDLLAFARLESGRETLVLESFDLRRIIDDCLLDLEVRAGKASLKLVKEMEEDLPNVYADEDKIHRVLTNLLSNAEKFTDDDAEITVTARRASDDRVEVSVADNGAGIPEESRAEVFDRFVRAQSSAPGTGIGLSLVREIIHGHNCDVEIGPGPDGGTRVAFTLPVARADAPVRPVRSPMGQPGDGEPGRRTVLIIDDDEDLIELCEKVLVPAGYSIRTARDGQGGVEAALSDGVDVVLIDIAMPGMSGIDVLSRLRSERKTKDLPIYMVSAQTADSSVKAAREAGCDGFITKPFSVSKLLEMIRSATSGR